MFNQKNEGYVYLIECENCGCEFDPLENQNCPSCESNGFTYEPDSVDWAFLIGSIIFTIIVIVKLIKGIRESF